MTEYRSIEEDLPRDVFEPGSKKKKKQEEESRYYRPGEVKVKMFLSDEELEELEPELPDDPVEIDCSDGGENHIPEEILKHILEQTEHFEKMLRAFKGKPTEHTHNAKKEFIGTAPSLIRNLALRVRYLQKLIERLKLCEAT